MYNPNDYEGESYERDERIARAAAERREDERDEARAREMAFIETPYCVSDCFDNLAHTRQCNYLNPDPIAAALNGWTGAHVIARKEAA